jgi:hypothetical protein
MRIGKKFAEGFLDSLGPQTREADLGISATRIWANCGHRIAVAADMAAQALFVTMIG